MSDRTLTNFIVSATYKNVNKTVSKHPQIVLSLKDQELLVKHLNKDVKPSSSMTKALERHKKYKLAKEGS